MSVFRASWRLDGDDLPAIVLTNPESPGVLFNGVGSRPAVVGHQVAEASVVTSAWPSMTGQTYPHLKFRSLKKFAILYRHLLGLMSPLPSTLSTGSVARKPDAKPNGDSAGDK